jgi:hypothetical protein
MDHNMPRDVECFLQCSTVSVKKDKDGGIIKNIPLKAAKNIAGYIYKMRRTLDGMSRELAKRDMSLREAALDRVCIQGQFDTLKAKWRGAGSPDKEKEYNEKIEELTDRLAASRGMRAQQAETILMLQKAAKSAKALDKSCQKRKKR